MSGVLLRLETPPGAIRPPLFAQRFASAEEEDKRSGKVQEAFLQLGAGSRWVYEARTILLDFAGLYPSKAFKNAGSYPNHQNHVLCYILHLSAQKRVRYERVPWRPRPKVPKARTADRQKGGSRNGGPLFFRKSWRWLEVCVFDFKKILKDLEVIVSPRFSWFGPCVRVYRGIRGCCCFPWQGPQVLMLYFYLYIPTDLLGAKWHLICAWWCWSAFMEVFQIREVTHPLRFYLFISQESEVSQRLCLFPFFLHLFLQSSPFQKQKRDRPKGPKR